MGSVLYSRREFRCAARFTARLFTGAYRSAIDDIDVPQMLFAIGKRLLR